MARGECFNNRPNTLPQTTSPHPNFLLAIGRRTIHCLGAGVRTSEEARSGSRQGERASGGRGGFERGTLNADRKANRKGANLFKGISHGLSYRHNSSESRAVLTSTGRATRLIARPNSLPLGPSPCLLDRPPDVGSSFRRTGIAGEIVVFKPSRQKTDNRAR